MFEELNFVEEDKLNNIKLLKKACYSVYMKM